MEPNIADSEQEIEKCKVAILAFRTNLDESHFTEMLYKMMAEEQFKIAYIPNDDNTAAVAFVGYRVQTMLRTGTIIYIDDLFTLNDHRGKGYAGKLLDFVADQAIAAGIRSIHLDSGYSLYPAHRLYLNKGYVLACNHFAKLLTN